MNHGPDPQLSTMSDAENDFRGQLEAVWPYVEWRVVHLWQDRWMVATSRHVAVEYKEDRKARTVAYAVEIGDCTERAPTLKEAVAAFAPVECGVDP